MREPTYRFRHRIAPQGPRTRLLAKHSPFLPAREVPFIVNGDERPAGRSPPALHGLCIEANARADAPHLQVHMQRAAGDPAADPSLAMPSPASADGYLCVVRTIRFNTPEIDKNTESGAILDGNPARADAHAYRQSVRKSANPILTAIVCMTRTSRNK